VKREKKKKCTGKKKEIDKRGTIGKKGRKKEL